MNICEHALRSNHEDAIYLLSEAVDVPVAALAIVWPVIVHLIDVETGLMDLFTVQKHCTDILSIYSTNGYSRERSACDRKFIFKKKLSLTSPPAHFFCKVSLISTMSISSAEEHKLIRAVLEKHGFDANEQRDRYYKWFSLE